MQTIGPYRLLQALGTCQVGGVWAAVDGSGQRVTMAVLSANAARDPKSRGDFAAVANELARTGQVPIIGGDYSGATPWIAANSLDGSVVARVFTAMGAVYHPLVTEPEAAAGRQEPTTTVLAAQRATNPLDGVTVEIPAQGGPASQPQPEPHTPDDSVPASSPPSATSPATVGQDQPVTAPHDAEPDPEPQTTVLRPSHVPPQAPQPQPSTAFVEEPPTAQIPSPAPPAAAQQDHSGPVQGVGQSTPLQHSWGDPTPTPPPEAPVPAPTQAEILPAPQPLSTPSTGGQLVPAAQPMSAPPFPPSPPSYQHHSGARGFGAPPASQPPPRRRRPWRLVGAGALALVVLGGAGTLIAMTLGRDDPPPALPASTPTPTATAVDELPVAPREPGIEPPIDGSWPQDWPEFGPGDDVQRMTHLPGVTFGFEVPVGWQCVDAGSTEESAHYVCRVPGGDSQVGGDLIVRTCPDPCDVDRRAEMRRSEEAWGVQWIRDGDYVAWAETTATIGGQEYYRVVFVGYYRTREEGRLDRQVVFRMTVQADDQDILRKTANSVRSGFRRR